MTGDVRACFAAATSGFVAVVSAIDGDRWEGPGLGQWTVRDLVGHTSRALSTIESYLVDGPGRPQKPPEGCFSPAAVGRDPLDYLLAVRGPTISPSAIAQRGREAGAALGDDPAGAVADLAERVTALVAATPDEATVHTALAAFTLAAYLPTRTFELTVHTLDLVRALGASPPAVLMAPVAACLQLAAAVAARGPDGADLLLALTGRHGLAPGFRVI